MPLNLSVDQTDAHSQPCDVMANFEPHASIRAGHDRQTDRRHARRPDRLNRHAGYGHRSTSYASCVKSRARAARCTGQSV